MSKITVEQSKQTINQLIPIGLQKIDDEDTQTVNARDVYEFLEVKEDFSKWIKRNIKKYEFVEGEEYVRSPILASETGSEGKDYLCTRRVESKTEKGEEYVCSSKKRSKTGSGGHNIKDYYITLNMAKELCMIQNNPKGKEVRQYFLQCEKRIKRLAKRALRQAEKKAQIAYQKARSEGKIIRREETDAIKEFVEYAEAHGSKNAHRYYVIFTSMVNKILFGVKKGQVKGNIREYLDQTQLIHVSAVDGLITRIVREGIVKESEYHKLSHFVKSQIESYAQLLMPAPLILENLRLVEGDKKAKG